jgi:hypothetical protein
MSEEHAALGYLTSLADAFWQWRDGGEVLAWANNTTIAFRNELAEVARCLAPRGLPPLGSIALVLAACRDSWGESSLELGTLAGALASAGKREMPLWLGEALGQLDGVCSLPPELRGTPRAKTVLVEMVLERCPNRTSPAVAAAVVQMLEQCLPPELLANSIRTMKWDELVREVQYVFDGLKRLDAESLEMRLRTGIDQIVAPAPLELEPAERACRLIAALGDDEELSGLARIARHLMAVVHLPRSISDREELPIDGFCDIIQRGPPERLLLSELANDDLTLAVRIGVGEALYVRREAPPSHPPLRRAVLIDSGVRLWGVPRVFAAAVGLSLVANARREIDVRTFRAAGREVAEVDLTRREGLIRHLEALECDADPALALPAFERAIVKVAATPARSEAVIVTSEKAAADREFQHRLAAMNIPTLYLATVSREGRFRLTARNMRGSRFLLEARLELDRLLLPRKDRTLPLVDKKTTSLPAIMGVSPFPLRLPYSWSQATVWPVEGRGVLGISHDGRLMFWDAPKQAARQLSDRLPVWKRLWWYGPVVNGSISAVIGGSTFGPMQIITLDLQSEDVQCVDLPLIASGLRGFCSHEGMLFAVHGPHLSHNANAITVLEMSSGRQVAVYKLPKNATWRQGRVIFFDNQFHALAWDGKLFWEPIIDVKTSSALISLWECYGQEGFVGLTRTGHLMYAASNETIKDLVKLWFSTPAKLLSIACDGTQACLTSTERTKDRFMVNVLRRKVSSITSTDTTPSSYFSDIHARHYLQTRTFPWRYARITAGSQCAILLFKYGNPQQMRTLCLARDGESMILRPGPSTAEVNGLEFIPVKSPEGTHFKLREARWPDGSRAWIDSRGLLHLRSSDPAIPEATLVLDNNDVSGWCSDGRLWGSEYYVDNRANVSAREIFEQVITPFLERLP